MTYFAKMLIHDPVKAYLQYWRKCQFVLKAECLSSWIIPFNFNSPLSKQMMRLSRHYWEPLISIPCIRTQFYKAWQPWPHYYPLSIVSITSPLLHATHIYMQTRISGPFGPEILALSGLGSNWSKAFDPFVVLILFWCWPNSQALHNFETNLSI